MTVVTRFAPSPTGFLHIGGARTALFNFLFARHHGGKYLLRIEDTDVKRSTTQAIDAILSGLAWLGLSGDEAPVFQSKNRDRHAEVVQTLLETGQAYKCYATPEELTAMREAAKALGKPMRYDGRWRDREDSEAPEGVAPAIRLKAPKDGETIINDLVQGEVRVANSELDDMVLMRSDGTPTYMLSVVVDDHDMGITHVIRGDDHLTNAFRQTQLFAALGWDIPRFAHISLIHGADGAKLSKRHGALGVEAYKDMGYLPAALNNYLLRLGWGHGDDEIISRDQAIEWFDLDHVGKSAARFDFAKLDNLNGHYIRESSDSSLLEAILPYLAKKLGQDIDEKGKNCILRGMKSLKLRAKNLNELIESTLFYVAPRPIALDDHAKKLLSAEGRSVVAELIELLKDRDDWTSDTIEAALREEAEAKDLKLGKLAQPLRAALTGSKTSPPIFEVMEILGREESLARLNDVL